MGSARFGRGMKAAVYEGARTFSIREIATPVPGPGQVLVRVKYCAICGTDVHAYLYDIAPPGTVMGHEFSGTVAALGPGVATWRVGDRVVGGGGSPPPGAAGPRDPRYNYRLHGFVKRPLRAYAEYTLMEEWEPLPIPEGVSDEAAAMAEPCTVSVHAVRTSHLKVGDVVAVIGAGPIGLLTLQVVRAAGAGKVLVSEPSPTRREAALQLGADAVLDPTAEDVVSRMVALSDGLGPQIVFECAGARDTLNQSLEMVAYRGQVMLVSLAWKPVPVVPVDWAAREIDLRSSFGITPPEWRIALRLLQRGAVTVAPLLDGRSYLPLERIPEAFEQLVAPSTQLQLIVAP